MTLHLDYSIFSIIWGVHRDVYFNPYPAESQDLTCFDQVAQWLSDKVLDSRQRAAGSSLTGNTGLCPLARHIISSLVLVRPRKTPPFITERLHVDGT